MNYFEDFPETSDEDIRKNKIRESARALEYIKHSIAQWLVRKEEEENKLQELLEHDKAYEGRKSYQCEEYVIRITTGWNWSVNEKEFNKIKNIIPPEFNPVREKIKYDINKPLANKLEIDPLFKAYFSYIEDGKSKSILSKKEMKMNVIVESKKS